MIFFFPRDPRFPVSHDACTQGVFHGLMAIQNQTMNWSQAHEGAYANTIEYEEQNLLEAETALGRPAVAGAFPAGAGPFDTVRGRALGVLAARQKHLIAHTQGEIGRADATLAAAALDPKSPAAHPSTLPLFAGGERQVAIPDGGVAPGRLDLLTEQETRQRVMLAKTMNHMQQRNLAELRDELRCLGGGTGTEASAPIFPPTMSASSRLFLPAQDLAGPQYGPGLTAEAVLTKRPEVVFAPAGDLVDGMIPANLRAVKETENALKAARTVGDAAAKATAKARYKAFTDAKTHGAAAPLALRMSAAPSVNVPDPKTGAPNLVLKSDHVWHDMQARAKANMPVQPPEITGNKRGANNVYSSGIRYHASRDGLRAQTTAGAKSVPLYSNVGRLPITHGTPEQRAPANTLELDRRRPWRPLQKL